MVLLVEFYIKLSKGIGKESLKILKGQILQASFLLTNVHRYTFLPILFIFMLELNVSTVYALYSPLSLFLFSEIYLGNHTQKFPDFFLHKFKMLCNQQRGNKSFRKKIFLGIFGQKDPKSALKKTCQI